MVELRCGRSSNQPRPCLAMYPIEYLVNRFLRSPGEPVVCARRAWALGSRLIGTIDDDRRKTLCQLLRGTEQVGRATILDVVHNQKRGLQRVEIELRKPNTAQRIAIVKARHQDHRPHAFAE